MTTTVVNIRKAPYDVYIGRAGKGQDGYYGNPYPLEWADRSTILEMFRGYFYARLAEDAEYKARVLELRGKVLGCFCKPLLCHGDMIAAYLDTLDA